MERGNIRWIRLIRLGEDPRGRAENRLAVLVTPPEWARGLVSLIQVSQEYRDVGLVVTNVGPSSQAAAAGIERGDVLLRYDGVPLETTEYLTRLEGVAAQTEIPRQRTLEAVRGAREMTFTVPAGPLGITASPLLHRLSSARGMTLGVIRGAEEHQIDQRADGGEATLVQVPRELVPKVSLLAEVLQRPINAEQRKKATALMVTAAGMA